MSDYNGETAGDLVLQASVLLSGQRVADVHAFEGHIACDISSRSEIVVPLVLNGELLGVLDLDSPIPGRFVEKDQTLLEAIAKIYLESID